tara:strand:- start:746 stop:967 length:222 start_codon:yes stop_codon:yes gene_type:complete
MSKETKKYKVYVTWTVGAEAVIDAESEEEAVDLAHGMDLDTFDGQDYVSNSFEVDHNMTEEVSNAPSEEENHQ